ncbi:MAG: L-2-hydroxyglutarate oxidase [Candidatus Omnitrophica bacterium]|nr:L-2-hydroxyglutarate oxidase [Candidatus Omnitrophota bacterium]MDD5672512.1 L-2-hydroxyglutarate oxidase [Candidatus Omnitrophota bacterium]
MKHFLIIGSGVVGMAVARALALRKAGKITLLDKESFPGKHASSRNSGVIHSGINQKPGSLKAEMCVRGSRLLREYCRGHHVPVSECGTLVVARREEETAVLERLLDLGNQCGVPDLRIIDSSELKQREPLAQGVAALLSPTGAAVDIEALLRALAEEDRKLGIHFGLDTEVINIDGHTVVTSQGPVHADYIVNCAGAHADRIAHFMDVGMEFRIIPFRGDYLEVKDCDVRTMIYQVPDLCFPFLSVHLTRETDGRVIAGPTATLSFGREAYRKEWDLREMLGMFGSRQFRRLVFHPEFLRLCIKNGILSLSKVAFYREIKTLVPCVEYRQLRPFRSGIRAQIVNSKGEMVTDMLVVHKDFSTHVLNAVSPGFTCSLAFAEHIADQILSRS